MYQELRALCNNVTKKSQINNIYINKKNFLKEKNIYLHIRGKNNCYIVTLVINLYVSRLEGVTKM